MTAIKNAIVVGGGIAGPVAALALAKAGIRAEVYEAYPRTDRSGAMLTVAPNGLAALETVGLRARVEAVGNPLHTMIMEKGNGRTLMRLPSLPGLPLSRVLYRADLFDAIRAGAEEQGIVVHDGKRLVGVEEAADGVTARFADGSSATAELLIGADGIHSTVRRLIDPEAPEPEYAGLMSFGFGDLTGAYRPGEVDEMHFAFGKHSFYGYWTQPDGSEVFFSNLPQDKPMTLAEARAVPNAEWLAKLRAAHAGDQPGERMLRAVSADELVLTGPMERMPKLPHWFRDRMVLVGDAAHAPSSSSGQGASLALESAVELAHCLRDLDALPAALAAYERLRRPRVEEISEQAAKTNNGKTAGPVAKFMFGLMMPIASRTFLQPEKMFGPVHRFRVEWDAKVTA
ncbi:FAD-dependent oxidoreductase [Catenulispora pinisilvae]|uniref:FAD-dependent oxidoreductase n=1 Tax=Catenulispora pinisilvae TaxID=2705253 RepID=UPI001890D0F4|nr:FAD-dependent monooxygenase [Catenulispora pinisilvae]